MVVIFLLVMSTTTLFVTLYKYYYGGKKAIREKTTLDLMEIYYNEKKKRLHMTFNRVGDEKKHNSNMDACLYEKEWYSTKREKTEESNGMEERWRKRIMFEWTPMGNVIFYYDVYKNGFAYYSDNRLMDYFLNAIAMKYVVLFKCRDLYMEEKHTPQPSPLIQIVHDVLKEEKEEEEAKKKKQKQASQYSQKQLNQLYVKPNRTPIGLPTIDKHSGSWWKWIVSWFYLPEKEVIPPIPPIPLYKNKFIRMGKIEDFSFLQKQQKTVSPHIFSQSTTFDEMFEGEHEVQLKTKEYSYADFKLMMSQSH
jgi:hypothetical protein